MTEEEIIEEEQDRLLDDYFNKDEIRAADDPIEEVMRQARKVKGSWGIMKLIGEKRDLAAALIRGRIYKTRRWNNREKGRVKRVYRQGGNLSSLSRKLERTPNSLYKLIRRLKNRGEL